jgi:peptidoglycan/xylan/chitin deacetylase (PgdA/CDA1 family)
MRRYISLIAPLLFLGISGGYGQSKLVFTGTYENNYHRFDSVLIEDINTGSKIVKYYPDTLLKLLITGVDEVPDSKGFSLSQNYPNPFEDKTYFNVYLPRDDKISINIFNSAGQVILGYERNLPSGNHSFAFTGSAEKIYLLSVRTRGYSASIRMVNNGSRTSSHAELEYTGNSLKINDAPKSKSGFDFNTGDNLVLTGYMTDGAGEVVSDTITDTPAASTIYTLRFEKIKRILILMYHKLTDSVPIDDYERNISDFENDLNYFQTHNYQMLSVNDLLRIQTGEQTLSSDGIIITFDDGYESCYSKAYTMLIQHQMPATFFLVTEWIGTPEYMTWSEVWLMSQYADAYGKNPFVMGSHTSSHPYPEQSAQSFPAHQDYLNFLKTELGDSKTWITDITGQTSIFLSLPFGDGVNNQDIINTAKDAGYTGIRTSVWNSFIIKKMNLYSLPAIAVLSGTPIETIENYLNY